jgi:hypothetical protein
VHVAAELLMLKLKLALKLKPKSYVVAVERQTLKLKS